MEDIVENQRGLCSASHASDLLTFHSVTTYSLPSTDDCVFRNRKRTLTISDNSNLTVILKLWPHMPSIEKCMQ